MNEKEEECLLWCQGLLVKCQVGIEGNGGKQCDKGKISLRELLWAF